jgi:putative restriction endonuclease
VNEHVVAAQSALERLRPWRRGEESAPHKPLLVLWALRRVQLGHPRLVDFNDAEPELRELIASFTPGRERVHPEYPFWRLQADGLWEVEDAGSFPQRQSNTDPPLSALRERHARGGFPGPLHSALGADTEGAQALVLTTLRHFFDASDHVAVLLSVGFQRAAGPVIQ